MMKYTIKCIEYISKFIKGLPNGEQVDMRRELVWNHVGNSREAVEDLIIHIFKIKNGIK